MAALGDFAFFESECTYIKPEEDCIDFTINDGFLDGLCCGWGHGWYAILLDDEVLRNETNYTTASDSMEIGTCEIVTV